MKKMKRKPKPRTVELVKHSYQPSKAELEEEISLDIPGGSVLERMENLAKAVRGPIKIRRIGRPRSRR